MGLEKLKFDNDNVIKLVRGAIDTLRKLLSTWETTVLLFPYAEQVHPYFKGCTWTNLQLLLTVINITIKLNYWFSMSDWWEVKIDS